MGLLAVLACLVAVQSEPQSDVAPFLKQYCVRCHGPEKRKGNLAVHDLGPKAEAWKSILEKISTGEMPPAEAAQPTTEQRRQAILQLQAAGVRLDDDGRPTKGNRLDHEALFSATGKAESSTPGRLWRVTRPAYEEFFQKVNSELKLGFKSYGQHRFRGPWEWSSDEGFRDYALSHRIDEPEIEQHLRNATRAAKAMASRISEGKGLPALQALAKSPEERHGSVHELLDALRAARDASATSSAASTPPASTVAGSTPIVATAPTGLRRERERVRALKRACDRLDEALARGNQEQAADILAEARASLGDIDPLPSYGRRLG